MVQPSAIPSRAVAVWRRLYSRYSLEPGPATIGPDVLKTIVPITDADILLRDPQGRTADTNLTAAAGTYVAVFTVPDGERWHLKRINRGSSAANTQIRVQGLGPNAASTIRVTFAGTGSEGTNLDMILDQGMTIGLLTTGNAGDTGVSLDLLYEREATF